MAYGMGTEYKDVNKYQLKEFGWDDEAPRKDFLEGAAKGAGYGAAAGTGINPGLGTLAGAALGAGIGGVMGLLVGSFQEESVLADAYSKYQIDKEAKKQRKMEQREAAKMQKRGAEASKREKKKKDTLIVGDDVDRDIMAGMGPTQFDMLKGRTYGA